MVLYMLLLSGLIGGCIAEFWDRQDVGLFRAAGVRMREVWPPALSVFQIKTEPSFLLLPSLTGY